MIGPRLQNPNCVMDASSSQPSAISQNVFIVSHFVRWLTRKSMQRSGLIRSHLGSFRALVRSGLAPIPVA